MKQLHYPYSKFTAWEHRFLKLAEMISTWSKDPSTKVGCVITQGKRVVGQGFNGFPQGVNDDRERYEDREIKYPMVVHAEANAIIFAGHAARGATIYCSLMPCADCAGMIIQAGVKTVICPAPTEDAQERWGKAMQIGLTMFEEAGVEVRLGVHE